MKCNSRKVTSSENWTRTQWICVPKMLSIWCNGWFEGNTKGKKFKLLVFSETEMACEATNNHQTVDSATLLQNARAVALNTELNWISRLGAHKLLNVVQESPEAMQAMAVEASSSALQKWEKAIRPLSFHTCTGHFLNLCGIVPSVDEAVSQ